MYGSAMQFGKPWPVGRRETDHGAHVRASRRASAFDCFRAKEAGVGGVSRQVVVVAAVMIVGVHRTAERTHDRQVFPLLRRHRGKCSPIIRAGALVAIG